MSGNRRLAWLLALAALAVGVVAIVSTAGLLSRPHDETGAAGSDSAFDVHGPTPAQAGPIQAAEYALTAMFSWQPARDASPGAAVSRAKPWLTGDLAASADAPPATGVRELPQWAGWRAAADVVTATAAATGTRDCSDQTCLVVVRLTQTVQHTDQTRTPFRTLTITAATTATPGGWRLGDYRITG